MERLKVGVVRTTALVFFFFFFFFEKKIESHSKTVAPLCH